MRLAVGIGYVHFLWLLCCCCRYRYRCCALLLLRIKINYEYCNSVHISIRIMFSFCRRRRRRHLCCVIQSKHAPTHTHQHEHWAQGISEQNHVRTQTLSLINSKFGGNPWIFTLTTTNTTTTIRQRFINATTLICLSNVSLLSSHCWRRDRKYQISHVKLTLCLTLLTLLAPPPNTINNKSKILLN